MKYNEPLISIIVPMFNRAQFLGQLFTTIAQQTYYNYELIIVDDGSTDSTKEWIDQQTIIPKEKLHYYQQTNSGPYAARNLGIKHATGKYIAFQDSDDEWPQYHLQELSSAMENNPDIDWIFGSIKRIEHKTRKTIQESNFYLESGLHHPFIKLKVEERDNGIKIIKDKKIGSTAILSQVPGSTQCALIKSSVFQENLFDPSYRTTYDRFFAIKLVLRGFTFAYVDKTHQIYHIHNDHISLVAGGELAKRISSAQTLVRGYKELKPYTKTQNEKNSLRNKISKQLGWNLALSYQDNGQYLLASRYLILAFIEWPRNLFFVKSAVAALAQGIISNLRPYFTNNDNIN